MTQISYKTSSITFPTAERDAQSSFIDLYGNREAADILSEEYAFGYPEWKPVEASCPIEIAIVWLSTIQRGTYSLKHFEQVKKDAVEEGLPAPSEHLIEDARDILNWMHQQVPYSYDLMPGDEDGVEIHAIHRSIYISLALFENGTSKCYVNMENERSVAVFDVRECVKGGFMEGALRNFQAVLAR